MRSLILKMMLMNFLGTESDNIDEKALTDSLEALIEKVINLNERVAAIEDGLRKLGDGVEKIIQKYDCKEFEEASTKKYKATPPYYPPVSGL
jgi:hypothetical protein